ncbi:putative peptidase a4 family protein [Diaporthe ampelina]|uniref:Putative peptidase a4 family protein n=1 Tax=Diaporthe ampelina TaxID=1214573 RepID=A0A0G2HUQ2_9PEZI|nr:putative peptidase a4 family protein [Diaporthe ampelina]
MRNNSYPEYSTKWSGSIQIGKGFNGVQGTIVTPRATGGSSAAAPPWVGLDGDTCSSAVLQTGISFYGDGSYDAWYEWIPDYSHSSSNFDISEADEIYMEVDASSKTTSVATL